MQKEYKSGFINVDNSELRILYKMRGNNIVEFRVKNMSSHDKLSDYLSRRQVCIIDLEGNNSVLIKGFRLSYKKWTGEYIYKAEIIK
jgi:hypothetical protein